MGGGLPHKRPTVCRKGMRFDKSNSALINVRNFEDVDVTIITSTEQHWETPMTRQCDER